MLNTPKPYSEYLVAVDDAEKYARESYTFRRMAKWQVWSMTAIVAALLLAVGFTAMVWPSV